MSEVQVTTVRVPKSLMQEYDKLPKRWLNFADFSREAIREKLERESKRV